MRTPPSPPTPSAEDRPRAEERTVFLSFAHQDARLAGRIKRALSRHRTPASWRAGDGPAPQGPRRFRIIGDRSASAKGGRLSAQDHEELARCEEMVVVCSPAAVASRWVNQQIAAFKLLGRGARITAVIAEGEAPASLPLALRYVVDEDAAPTETPDAPPHVTVDVRPRKQGGLGVFAGVSALIAALIDMPRTDVGRLRLTQLGRDITLVSIIAGVLLGVAVAALSVS